MSGSTQATGRNAISRALTSPAALTLCCWVKVNAYDKTGFDSYFSIENAAGGASFKGIGLQQDAAGAGTADLIEGYWFNGSGPAHAETPTLISDTGVWHFFAMVWSGTAITIYYGTETGTLSTQTLTANFNSTDATIAFLGTDSGSENANASFRGARLWLAALTSGEITAERDSTTFAAVRSSNLDSDVRIASGTAPNVATTGTSWTLLGTWADDASNPAFTTTALPAPPIAVNRRAPGFPRRAPLPGIPRLGSGLLVSQTSTYTFQDGAAVVSSFATTATGALTFTATGTAASSSFAADATAVTSFIAAFWAQPQPLARGYPARRPAPPPPQVGRGTLVATTTLVVSVTGTASAAFGTFDLSSTGLLTFTATGSSSLSPFAITATGFETFTATASATMSPFAVTATGIEIFDSTATAAFSPFAVTSAGLETFTGSATAACSSFDASGSSASAFSGSASAVLSPFAVSGSAAETFSGLASAACSSFAVSCSGSELFTGSATAVCQPFGSAGNGALGAVFTGSGAATIASFATTSAGLETFTATASAGFSSFASSATGTESFIGLGSSALSPFAVSGNAALGATFIGSGAATMSPFAAVTSGNLLRFIGSGSSAVSPFDSSGSGSETYLGSGTSSLSQFGAAVTGLVGSFIGVGTVAMAPFAIVSIGIVPITYTRVTSHTKPSFTISTPTSHSI